jgi:hypothetical protein
MFIRHHAAQADTLARTMPISTGLVSVFAVLAALVLAGCSSSSGNGIASKTPTEMLAATKAAAEKATSVRVLSRTSQGRLSSTSDLQLASDGGHAYISLLGLVYEVTRIGQTLYLKGNRTFDSNLEGVSGGKIPAGKWLEAPADKGHLAEAGVVTYLGHELGILLGHNGPVSKGATTIINGQKAIELKETTKLYSGSLYIATTGRPYPIEIVKHGHEQGQTVFSDWNQPVTLRIPAGVVAAK